MQEGPKQFELFDYEAQRRRLRSRARVVEGLMRTIVYSAGTLAILAVVLIFVFLFSQAVPVLKYESFGRMLLGTTWKPTAEPPQFGMLPLIVASLMITAGATVIAVPLGLAGAIYISELATPRAQAVLKPAVELLAAVPSVVYGFLGLTLVSPFVRKLFHLPTGLTGFTAAIILAYMALSTILSLCDDALRAVPRSIRLGALALGITRWQMIRYAVLPAARRGIVPAIMLGIGRAVGETMTVLMVAGMAPVIPHTLFQPMRPMTATIAAEMGEAARGTAHFHALFMVGAVLFVITFVINLAAELMVRREEAVR